MMRKWITLIEGLTPKDYDFLDSISNTEMEDAFMDIAGKRQPKDGEDWCDECGGRGWFQSEDGDRETCKGCDGSGVIEV